MTEFMECDLCQTKPGSVKLCDSCTNNRDVITGLKDTIRQLQLELKIIEAIKYYNLGIPIKDSGLTEVDLVEYIIKLKNDGNI